MGERGYVSKTYRIGPHRLKSLALAGRIRTVHRTIWPTCLYSREDVLRYQAELTRPLSGPRPKPEMSEAK